MSGKHSMRVLTRLLVHLIIFANLIASKAETKIPMAKPNCTETCGGVTIPYPFGIGNPYCYLNPFFEITCNSYSHRPFLHKFNLEVFKISVSRYNDRSLIANYPVYATCRDGSLWNSSDLLGSPFLYSYTNRFVTVGCENTLMKDQRDKVLAGCTSTCRATGPSSKGCYGINCCQTTFPSSLEFYRLASTANYTTACNYAFLVSNDWFEQNFSSKIFTSDRKNYVPVDLRWGIQKFEFPGGIVRDSAYYCFLSEEEKLYTCRCHNTYEGNPYILNGCRVVSACAKCNGRCSQDFDQTFRCIPNRRKEIIIGGIVVIVVIVVILFLFCFGMYKSIKKIKNMKKKKKFFKKNGGLLLKQHISTNADPVDTTKIFTAKELMKATDKFNISRVLGQGGQGTVYKGMLTDGKIVAVKKSTLVDESQVGQFINEVSILSQINHRNIVKLLGCCLETEVPLLVYEYISNGTLSQLIRNQDDELLLTWEMRLQIATEVSGALAYLHSATSVPIYHRDIKSSNILLDDKYRAKVADFGTSRSVAVDQTHMTTIVQGTFGYLDPEFYQSSQFTDKSDVYSFGVVLAELLTGEKPIMSKAGQDERNLATYFISALEGDFLFEIIDEKVAKEGSKDEIIALAILARRCLNLSGRQRPTMKEVMLETERIRTYSLPSDDSSSKFHDNQSIDEKKKNQSDISSTSVSNNTYSVSGDSYPLMFTS